jgi:hypothetical protein
MKPAVDVEELAGHEIAFGRGQKEHGADQSFFTCVRLMLRS